jgi:ATP-dependent Lhr-like helicase
VIAPGDGFRRLHRKLQEPLYRMRWTSLRPIQEEAIPEILDGRGDLILSARTAAGKTEAAYLPILSRMVDDPGGGVRAIYAGPLKALINDQYLRLEDLCERAEIPVHRWHGDVGQAAKGRLLEEPSGVLLITPESIESLFVNHAERLPAMFGRLAFVVIDELHSFLGTERGAHLRSLIARLSAKSREPVRRVGLSATLGDLDAARRWLRPGDPGRVRTIEGEEEKTIRLKVSGYPRASLAGDDGESSGEGGDPSRADPLMSDVFDAFVDRTALIFANSKRRLELCADFARRESERRGIPDRFRIHHGSLSKAEREATEDALRSGRPTAAFCSSTLELGIDVGNVEAIGQIGAPWSVGSMAQRLGRSGRREGEASEMRVFIEDEEPGPQAGLVDRLHPELLQAIAMAELMLGSWCEPPEVDRLHLSTLVQQVLSLVAESGGARADQIFSALVQGGPFANVDQPTLVQVLRDMGAADFIEQTPEGALILGLRGEAIVRRHDFYVAFRFTDDYRVLYQGRHVGDVTMAPGLDADGFVILAGRRWKILGVDRNRRVVEVEPSSGGRVPWFRGTPGPDVHPKVRETMRALLGRRDTPTYLDPDAVAMLASARASASESGLLDRSFVEDGPRLIWFTWTGTRIQRTLAGLGRHFGGLDPHDEGIALTFEKATEPRVREVYREFLTRCPTAEELAAHFPDRAQEKYEPFLSEPLQARVFARHCLDLDGAIGLVGDTIA